MIPAANRFDRRGRVVAKDPVDLCAVSGQRQAQPKQDDMLAAAHWPAHHAMERQAFLRHSGMNVPPVVRGGAGEHEVEPLAGDLLAVDVAKPSACQSEPRFAQSIGQIDQADAGEQLGNPERIDI